MIRSLTKRIPRPTHATVVAYAALFVALATGSAWAAATIGPSDIKNNAIHSRHINKNAVKARKIAKGAVGTGKLAAGAVTGGKVGADTLTGDNINEGSLDTVPQAFSSFNSNNLAGLPADAYVRRCTGGTIAGYVYVKGSATFSSSYTSSNTLLPSQFNCTGNSTAVQVKRVAAGTYYVDFPSLEPVFHLVATGNETVDAASTQDENVILTYKLVMDAAIGKTVYRVKTTNPTGTNLDREFSFSVDS
jgi:hypothetical protein